MNQPYQQPYQQFPPATRTSTLAIISLIGGITGLSLLPFLGAIVAVITGHMAQSEINKSGGMITGKGMATAGLILGYLVLVGGICIGCLFLLSFILPLVGIGLTIPFFSNSGY
jgi:hypothetical protein